MECSVLKRGKLLRLNWRTEACAIHSRLFVSVKANFMVEKLPTVEMMAIQNKICSPLEAVFKYL